jgi:hypothetical protein
MRREGPFQEAVVGALGFSQAEVTVIPADAETILFAVLPPR